LPVIRSIIKGEKYGLTYDISTIAIPAWLIASKDVPTKTILNFLYKMEAIDLKDIDFDNDNFTDNIAHAISKYKSIKESEASGNIDKIIIFVSTFVMSYLVILVIVRTICSKIRQSTRFSKIHQIYIDHIGLYKNKDSKPGDSSNLLPLPKSEEEGTERLDCLIDGIRKLDQLVKDIREDYRDGTLLIMDMRFLLDRLYGVREIFQRRVAQFMIFLISSMKKKSGDIAELRERLEEYYVTSCITKDDYKWLSEEDNEEGKVGK
jgi:hypothetical protein